MLLVKTTGAFQCEVKIQKKDIEVDGKSIMGILMLAAGKGTQLTFTCNGVDEKEAMDRIAALIDDGFGED